MSPGKRRGGRGPRGGQFPNIPLPNLPGEPADQVPVAPASPRRPETTKSGAALPQLPDEGHTPAFRETVFGFVTGRHGAVGVSDGNVSAQLIAAYGESARDPSRPDTAAAAKGLGVTQRTVQRWVKGEGVSKAHAAKVSTQARKAMTTKRGRARAMKAAQAAGSSRRPVGKNAITVGGTQGVRSGLDENYRPRDTAVGITDDDLASLQELWVEHGSDGAADWLHSHFDQHFVSDWHFTDIEEIGWGNSNNY